VADVVDAVTRSRMMSGIRGRDTKPERALRSALHRLGLRFRLHSRDLPGRPDIVLPRHTAAVLVHGCFWHQHPGCRYATTPASNAGFWREKLKGNVERDGRNLSALVERGWRTAVIWECVIRQKGAASVGEELATWIRSGEQSLELPPRGTGDQS
jgi:DNA mismatch endonuclease, patch repair protein